MASRENIAGGTAAKWLWVLLIWALLPSCTRNNGDIGEWFGTWQMTGISADGVPDDTYERNIFWKFQNDVICLVRVDTSPGANARDDVWGTWEDDGDKLLLDFSYSDDQNPVEYGENHQGIYAPYPELHLPYGEVSTLTITERTSGKMTLLYTAQDGVTYAYTIKKQK